VGVQADESDQVSPDQHPGQGNYTQRHK
jgi:hypothetical protein